MKAVMFTVPCSPERVRFSNALHHATEVIRSIAIEWCRWDGNDFIFEGDEARYQKLYFWICGYGDALAVMEQETRLRKLAAIEDQSLTSVGGLVNKLHDNAQTQS